MSCTSRLPMLLLTTVAVHVLACGTTAPSRFYSLQPLASEEGADAGAGSLRVRPWSLPEYLNRPQLVKRSASSELRIDEYHRWAEPLADGFNRVMIMNLSTLLASSTVWGFSADSLAEADFSVGGRVYRFDVDESGLAVLDAQWWLMDRDRQLVRGPTRVRFSEQADSKRSDDAAVQALSRTLARFSREIAGALQQPAP